MVDDLFEDESIVTEEYIEELAAKLDVDVDEVVAMDDSLLADVGNAVAFVFKPLGFGSWRPTVATVTGLVAKEEVVGTFGVLYNYDDSEEELSEEGDEIWDNVAADFDSMSNGHGKLAAFSFLLFNLLCAPCFAAMGAMKREMNNGKWTAFAIVYECVFAYAIALMTYQIGLLVVGAANFGGLIIALALLAFLLYMLFRPNQEATTLTTK